jgi:hypothetical protein
LNNKNYKFAAFYKVVFVEIDWGYKIPKRYKKTPFYGKQIEFELLNFIGPLSNIFGVDYEDYRWFSGSIIPIENKGIMILAKLNFCSSN